MHYTKDILPDRLVPKTIILNESGKRVITITQIQDSVNKISAFGHAICNPGDDYDEDRGVLIAEGRAAKAWFEQLDAKCAKDVL